MNEDLRVIIYGAGNYCRERISTIPNEWNVIAIADKDSNKWGQNIESHVIINPNEIHCYEYDVIIIFALLYGREIMKELQEMGIDTWRIIQGAKYHCEWDRSLYYADLTKKYKKICSCRTWFEDRRSKNKKLLYILIGYKDFLWEDVLERVKLFCPNDIDVCLLSSGRYDDRLSAISKHNNWSYFVTDINNILYAQNLMMASFSEKEYIYKMDEDVYVTENCFNKMFNCLDRAQKSGELNVGYVTPIIPLSSSSYIFLEEFGLVEKYKKTFKRKLYYGGDLSSPEIRSDSNFSHFYWSIDNIDMLSQRAENNGGNKFRVIAGRHAICFILFSREFFNSMGGFDLGELEGIGYDWKDGDEFQIMQHCINFGYYGLMTLDSVCGHFCYAKQEKDMIKFRRENPYYFKIIRG